MADKLVVYDDGFYRLGWSIEENDGEIGATVGETLKAVDDPEPDRANKDDWEFWKAETIARGSEPNRDECGYRWPSQKAAREVLRQIQAAFKQRAVPEMPTWAVKALAAGWKPPKGWKP
jgi:hypothetical protein